MRGASGRDVGASRAGVRASPAGVRVRRAARTRSEPARRGLGRRDRVLLFDLDGTLTDSKPGIVRCIRYAVEQLGGRCPPDDELTRFIGPPLEGTFGTLLATSDASRLAEAVRLYRHVFHGGGLFENQVYDGVPEMLAAARSVADRAYVVTAKLTVTAQRVVTHFGLDHHFAGIYGLEDHHVDKAELLAHVLEVEGIPPAAAMMIGDRASDIAAARANAVGAIGVLWGYGSEHELAEARPDALCKAPAELIAYLAAGPSHSKGEIDPPGDAPR